MKIIFYGASPEIKEITQSLNGHESLFIDEIDEVKSSVGNDEVVLVLNADFNLDDAKSLNQRYSSVANVKTILVSGNLEMETENLPATVGLYGDFNPDKLKSAILDNAVSESATMERDIQDAFNMAFGEEEPAVEEVPKSEEAQEENELELLAEVDTGVALEEDGSGLELGTDDSASDLELGAEDSSDDIDLGTDEAEPAREPEPAPAQSGSGSYSIVDEESDLTFNLGPDLDAEPAPVEEAPAPVEEVVADVEEKVAQEASAELDLGEDLGEELALGDDEQIAEAPKADDVGDLDLDLGEDLRTQSQAAEEPASGPEPAPAPAPAPAPDSDVPVEFTVEIPSMEEELVSSTNTEVASEPEKAEVEAVVEEEEKVVEDRVVYQYDDNAMVRLEATIRQLREEREDFLKQVDKLNIEKNTLSSENLGFKSEVEGLRVEVELLKKRNNEEREEYKLEKQILQDSLISSEQKIKNLEGDVNRLAQKSHIDIQQIRQKERDLEGQLELLSMDSQNQINNRESKIQELKRKADALEFNMENMVNREAEIRAEKLKVEEKLNKVMKSMRSSIKFLEEELETDPEFLRIIKKEAA
jgi:hypothetical protein